MGARFAAAAAAAKERERGSRSPEFPSRPLVEREARRAERLCSRTSSGDEGDVHAYGYSVAHLCLGTVPSVTRSGENFSSRIECLYLEQPFEQVAAFSWKGSKRRGEWARARW